MFPGTYRTESEKNNPENIPETELTNLPSKSGVGRILSGTEIKEKSDETQKITNIINWKFCKLVSLKLRRIFEEEYFVMSIE